MEKKTTFKGFLLLVLTAVVWGFAFVAQTAGSDHVGSFLFNAIRFALGTISLIPVICIFERNAHDPVMKKTTWIAGIVCGVVLFSASSLQQLGIALFNEAGYSDSSGRAGFLTALYMVIVPIIGLFMKKRPSVFTWFGIVFAAVGLFFVSVSESFTISSEDLVVISCALLFAVHIVIIDRFGDRMYSLRFAMTQFAVCALLSAVFQISGQMFGIIEPNTFADVRMALLPILYGGFMSVGVAYTCQILGQKNTEPALASVIMSTEAMFSAIGGALILQERMTPRGYLGCSLIFIGILLTQVQIRKKAV